MSWWNDLGTWFTGRNGIYKDDEKVEAAIDDLEKIKSSIGPYMDDPINKAISELNAVTGMADYVGTFPQGAFDEITICAEDGINAMINQIEAKKHDMDEYEKGSFIDHALGTVSMASGKIVEGFVSVFEGIGDAALTAANWIGSIPVAIATGEDYFDVLNSENNIAKNLIEINVSEAIASPLTNNALAQNYSVFTADSGAASICKGVGKTAGYMFLGGQLAGVARGISGGSAMMASTEATGVAGALQSTTNATALIAGVSGFGQGTETGLLSGKSFQASTGQGAIQGVVEGGTMYLGGKLVGERAQINNATKAYETATNPSGSLEQTVAQIRANGGYTSVATQKGLQSGYNAQQAFASESNPIKGVAAFHKSLRADDPIKQRLSENYHNTKYKENGEVVTDRARIKELRDMSPEELAANDITTPTKLAPVRGTARTAFDVFKLPVTATQSVIAEPQIAGLATTGQAASQSMVGNAVATGLEVAEGAVSNKIDRDTNIGINSDYVAVQHRNKPDLEPVSNNAEFVFAGQDQDPDPDPSGNNDPTNNNTPTGNNHPTDNTQPSNTEPGPGYDNTSGVQPRYEDPSDTNKPDNDPTKPNTTDPTEPNVTSNIVFENNASSNEPDPSTTDTNVPTDNPTGPNETTNPDNPTPEAVVPTGPTGGTSHTGGGYTGGGYTADNPDIPEDASLIDDESIIDVDDEDVADSIDSIISGGSNFTKLPTSNTAVHGSSSGSAVIPVIAGLSAAAAAGIGAKAYMDRKTNNDNGEDDFETDEWTGEEDLDIDYNDGVQEEQYLDDDYEYQAEESTEKYGARNNDELADMQ